MALLEMATTAVGLEEPLINSFSSMEEMVKLVAGEAAAAAGGQAAAAAAGRHAPVQRARLGKCSLHRSRVERGAGGKGVDRT